MKKNNFLFIISVLTLIFIVLGATFSFFRVEASSSEGAVTVGAANLNIVVDVQPLYIGKVLIPLDNDKVMTAFNNSCVDNNDNGACQAYTISIDNAGQNADYAGIINFTLNGITNLNYMVLDENNNVYQDITNIVSGTDQSLGPEFNLLDGGSKNYTLIIWVPNFNRPQDTEDAGGSFNAAVTYETSYGSRITGTFSGSNG